MAKKQSGAYDLDTVILLDIEQVPVESDDIVGSPLQCRGKKDVIRRILRDIANDIQIVGHKCLQMDGSDKVLDERVGDSVPQEDTDDFCQDRKR